VLFDCEPPKPRIERVRVVNMNASTRGQKPSLETRDAYLDRERVKSELKVLLPEDAKEAYRSRHPRQTLKIRAVSFDLVETEVGHASIQ
jgi:hypothetical protein